MAADEALALLRSIDASLKELVAIARGRQPKPVASDRDLDGKYGDPVVKFNPRDWTGPSCIGRHLSECPAPFLELLAETYDYFAKQADEKNERTDKGRPVSDYKRQDAARARGWVKRIREGKVHQAEPVTAGGPSGPEWESGF